MFNRARSALRCAVSSTACRVSVGAAALVASSASHATGTGDSLSAAAVAALSDAQTQVGTTGTAVIACVAALVVIGIVIACVRKA
jgi:hypothetical protein